MSRVCNTTIALSFYTLEAIDDYMEKHKKEYLNSKGQPSRNIFLEAAVKEYLQKRQ